MTKPQINVTPLIDVLLVLLIIFMVITPTKPSSFDAKIPHESKQPPAEPNPYTLVVTADTDSRLRLNNEELNATIADPDALVRRLSAILAARTENQVFAQTLSGDVTQRIEKTVFIKAPRLLNYGSVAKIVDAVKLAGAAPISLQIDGLD